jgi:hypothetical protein
MLKIQTETNFPERESPTMNKLFIFSTTCIIGVCTASNDVRVKHRKLMDELTASASSGTHSLRPAVHKSRAPEQTVRKITPQKRTARPQPTTNLPGPSSTQPAAKRPLPVPVVQRASNRRSYQAPQKTDTWIPAGERQNSLTSDIGALAKALHPTITDDNVRRIALYWATTIAEQEKKQLMFNDFSEKLHTILGQLREIKKIVTSKKAIIYRAFRLDDDCLCCGKRVHSVVGLLDEVETAIISQDWGRYITFGGAQAVVKDPKDFVNEDSVAGSWVLFLHDRLEELEAARSVKNDLDSRGKEQIYQHLVNRTVQLRELCNLLRESALRKQVGLEYQRKYAELRSQYYPDVY